MCMQEVLLYIITAVEEYSFWRSIKMAQITWNLHLDIFLKQCLSNQGVAVATQYFHTTQDLGVDYILYTIIPMNRQFSDKCHESIIPRKKGSMWLNLVSELCLLSFQKIQCHVFPLLPQGACEAPIANSFKYRY